MPVRLSCPYCNTDFDLARLPAAVRTPCPRCGEGVPVKASDAADFAPPEPSANGTPHVESEPAASPSALRPLLFIALGLLAIVLVAIGLWLGGMFGKKPTSTPPGTPPAAPPATKPPQLLGGLKYLPKDAQFVAAVQPSAILQYAERKKLDPKDVFAELGVPAEVLDGLADAGVSPDKIDHLTVGLVATDLRAVLVLVLRSPLKSEDRFRQKLEGKVDPDHPDRTTVSLPGLPRTLTMVKADAVTYLFVTADADAATAKQPTAGFEALRDGVKESIGQVSQASFAWAATDSDDWSKNKGVDLAARFAGQAELKKGLEKVRAAAVGVSVEEAGVQLTVAVKGSDPSAALEVNDRMKAALAEAKAEVSTADNWSTAGIPFDPPKDGRKLLQAALRR